MLCHCFFTTLHAQSSQQHSDIRYWTPSHRLSFSDFGGKLDASDTASRVDSPRTLTHRLGSIVTSIDVHYESKGGKTVFTIQAAMKKASSWIKAYGDTITLKHEQGHFDLCEIYARTLRRDIQRTTRLSEAEAVYKNVSAAEEQEQESYDKENTFQKGGITPVWSSRITSRLKDWKLTKVRL